MVQSSLCFSVSHHIAFSPGRMVDFFLVSFNVSGHPAVSCLCQSTYTSAIGLSGFRFPLHSAFARSNFPLPVSCTPCVLLHSFLLSCSSWDKFASYFRLITPAINTLTKDGAIVSLTLASPLASDGIHKRFCRFYNCRVDGEVSTTQNVPPPSYFTKIF